MENLKDKLQTVAGMIPKVYEAGVEEGKVRERGEFWDVFQNYGNRTYYNYACAYGNFDASTFYPTHNIIPTSAQSMFYDFTRGNSLDLVQRLKECGVTLDFSKATTMLNAFAWANKITTIPTVDLRGLTNPTNINAARYLFSRSRAIVTIEKLILTEDIVFADWFGYCDALEEIRIEGTIGQNGFDIHWSTKLSRESIESILDALSRSPTVESPTITVSKTAVDKAYETSPGANDGSESYDWLVACQGPESPNAWNIILN